MISPHGVGTGLGAPDAEGDRETLPDKIDCVMPLRASGLYLVPRDAHFAAVAVVYDGDVSINYDDPMNGSLKGATHDISEEVSAEEMPSLIADVQALPLGPDISPN